MRAVYITLGVRKVPRNRHMLNDLLQNAPYIDMQLVQLITRILFNVVSNWTQRNTRDTLARVSLAVRYAFACHRRRRVSVDRHGTKCVNAARGCSLWERLSYGQPRCLFTRTPRLVNDRNPIDTIPLFSRCIRPAISGYEASSFHG